MRGVRERRGKCEYLVAGSPAGVVLGHVGWQGEGSERGLRESLAAGDHPENWRAAFTRWRAAV